MPDPKSQLLSFPLDLGVDLVSDAERVSPFGERPRVTQSLNTRLTKTPGRVSKSPAATSLGSSLSRLGGIVPCGNLDSKVAFAHPGDGGNQRIAGSTVGLLSSLKAGSPVEQNYFYPAQVSRAGSLMAGMATFQNPATCHDVSVGYTYFATISSSGTTSSLVMSVIDDEGTLLVAPRALLDFATPAADGRFVALSCHGAGVVRLWYQGNATTSLIVRSVVVSGQTIALAAPSTLFVPSSAAQKSIALAYDPLDTGNAYLVCFTAAGTDLRVLRVDPLAMSVTAGVNIATGGDPGTNHAVAYAYDGSTRRLVVLASWFAGNCSLYELNATSLATVWSQTNRLWYGGSVSCGFLRTPDIDVLVFAATRAGSVATIATPGGTQFEFRAPTTGGLVANADLPWHGMVGQIAQHKVTDTQWYPLIAAQVYYDGVSTTLPTSVEYVSDPSVEVFTPQWDAGTSAFFWSLRGRFGTDTCIRYSHFGIGMLGGCNSFLCTGDVARLVYLAENTAEGMTFAGYIPRYVDMDMSPSQPAFTLLSSGQAIIAGAMPAVWDGSEISEYSPIRAPKIFGTATGGSGNNLTGTYLFAAVVSWKDAAGNIHRSPPSNIITLSPAGTKVALYVTKPVTYLNGTTQRPIAITLYASQAGGTVLYAQTLSSIDTTGSTGYWTVFLNVFTPVQSALTPALYSDGTPATVKACFCPNAFRAARAVADRVWLLDAESNRAFYSQPMNTEALGGVFPSFNPTQYVAFPAAAGDLVSVENWRESPMFLTRAGVWTVDGEGPNALNDPPFFSAPRQVSDCPCTDARSVVLTPVGIMFRSHSRFVLLAGGEPVVFDDVAISTDIVGCAVFRDYHEVAFVTENKAYVFNYKLAAWTVWDANTFDVAGTMSAAIQDPRSDNLIYYSPDDAELFSMDPDSVSTTAQITIETGWIVPGGPQDDSRLENVVARCAKGGTHGVSLQIGTDYQALQTAKPYTSTDVDDMVQNGRYDLYPQPRDMPARAARLSIVETGATGEGMQPLNVTLELVRNVGKLAQSLRRSGRK